MRISGIAATRTLSCVLLLVAVANCRPLTPREDPVPPDPHVKTTSDGSVTHPDGQFQQNYGRIEEFIEGHAAGVQVIHKSDGTFGLRIRGVSSPSSNNEPLIVVDGISMDSQGGRALSSVNPADVVKIDVLRDAASTAYYGMRGGNGVILITTRQE